ncbi:MAG TPA: ATP-binding cassette domain-containing protein [Galbitalea sp.]|jgi:ABC-type sugar transport system ATPase subunit|nr:ATP-binding cassette domain-containing protein [Galbitalea sp.]
MLELRDIEVRFGAITALSGITFSVKPGEIVALVGDNGAGKSTLLSIMSGARRPSGGSIIFGGETVEFSNPRAAARHGIQMVYQDLALIPAADVATNMFLSREILRRGPLGLLGWLDKKTMRREAGRQLDTLGVTTLSSVQNPVEMLSGGQRQSVALARAALALADSSGGGVLLLDEPTAALGYRQSRSVEDFIRRVAGEGIGVVLVTHDLPLCFEVADRVAVLYHGKLVAELQARDTHPDEVVGWITGSRLQSEAKP